MTDKMPKKNLFSSQINLSKFKPADEDEKRQKEIMSESTTFFKDGMKKLMRNPLAVGSIIVLLVLIVTIIVAPMIVPYGYEEINNVDGGATAPPQTWPVPVFADGAGVDGGDGRVPLPAHFRARTASGATTSCASSTARASRWPSASLRVSSS